MAPLRGPRLALRISTGTRGKPGNKSSGSPDKSTQLKPVTDMNTSARQASRLRLKTTSITAMVPMDNRPPSITDQTTSSNVFICPYCDASRRPQARGQHK